MSKKFHFHACDIRVVCEQRCAVEHCLLWRDLSNPHTHSATIDDVFNALETRYDGWANVDWEEEFVLTPFGLSADGIELLRSEPYFVVNKETGDISEDDMYCMCAVTGVDPVELANACDTDVEWREKIDDAICRAMLNHGYLIEFRSEEDAREWVAEHVAKRVSIDNGLTFLSADEAIDDIESRGLWDAVVAAMDDDVREDVHNEMAPCTNKGFLERYLVLAYDDLVI